MTRHGAVVVLTSFLAMMLFASHAGSAPRLKLPLTFARVEADPDKSYELNEEHGPWLIVAASFLGETGERQASQLVIELRRKYKLNAYTFKRNFDFGETVDGLGVDKYGKPKRMKHVHSAKFEETAVLVGDFDAHDDPRAQKVLEKIKYARPDALKISSSTATSQRMAVWREIQRRISADEEMKRKGPMRSAFISRNPLLPEEYFAPKGPDKLIIDLNQGLEYSLLDCPGEYTVRVATFRGDSTWDLKQIERAQHDTRLGVTDRDSKLVEGAKKTRLLVAALRKRGVEAYQFHDRFESIVTVGSFDSVGETRADGRIDLNPKVHQIMEIYKAQQEDLPGLPGALRTRMLDGVSFDPQPLPVKVPRPSATADFARASP